MTNITIGSDSEFVLSKNGKLILPTDFFESISENNLIPRIFGITRMFNSGMWYKSRIGVDGGDMAGEFRPMYYTNPLSHYEAVRRCIKSLSYIIKCSGNTNIKVLAGNYHFGESLGGHIHIGGVRATNDRIYAFDEFLNFWLKRIYNTRNEEKRINYDYGHRGDWRPKSYGFEYRSPASWIVEPEIAKSVICLAKVVGNEPVTSIKKHLYRVRYSISVFGRFKELRTFKYYNDYSKHIRPLILRSIQKQYWNENADILHTWGFR